MTRQNVASGSPFEDVHGYCRAVRVGNQVHVAGTCAAMDALEGTDTYEQAVSALGIITTAMSEVGAGPADVVRTVIYVTDIDRDMQQVARAHLELFDDVRPVSTMVEVAKLVDPRMTVEIEVYAIIDA
ncbi:RidA family protein [bacterium]|nr:RidA family protein [bacterium]MDB2391536.1 Rid family hydrolase [Acidimicrobiaceae bacterium]MDC0349919.1 Rid family hydrolase [bacterium]